MEKTFQFNCLEWFRYVALSHVCLNALDVTVVWWCKVLYIYLFVTCYCWC